MNPAVQIEPILQQLRYNIDQLLLLLSQKEKFVIQRRFGIDEKTRSTLEEIGRSFQVTRERVRQIEKNALQKLIRNVANSPVHTINQIAYQILEENGGLMREDLLIGKLLSKSDQYSFQALQLILSLEKRFERVPNTVKYHPYVKFNTLSSEFIKEIAEQICVFLEKEKKVKSATDIVHELRKSVREENYVQIEMLLALCHINRLFKVMQDEIGLVNWRHINPRTIKDKIYYILRQNGKPMHFVEIANEITKQQFDKKTLNLQAIHNELIRFADFILIGRGIYGLREWGYETGTVSDVIEGVLKKRGSMRQDEIVEEVLKQRKVKAITVILNLKNKRKFVRVGRQQYALNK